MTNLDNKKLKEIEIPSIAIDREQAVFGRKKKPKKIGNIFDCKIIKRTIYRGRMHVTVEPSFNGKRTILYAHYVWLFYCPAFSKIPKGFSIHHLDHDKTNDDISNLALMQTNFHIAHHKKYWPSETEPIEIIDSKNEVYFPGKPPKVCWDKSSLSYYLSFYESAKNGGDNKSRKIWRYNEKKLRTKELAEKASQDIWNDFQLRKKLGSDTILN